MLFLIWQTVFGGYFVSEHDMVEFKFLLSRYRQKHGYHQYAVFLSETKSYELLDIHRFFTYALYEYVEHHDN